MHAAHLDDDGHGSKIGVGAVSTQVGILAPSIQDLWVNEGFFQGDPSNIVVSGLFGPRDDGKYKRELFINGKPLNITDGDETTIIADIPDEDGQDTPAAGLVTVAVGGRISNEVPLTLYDIPMIWTFVGPDSLKITQNLHFVVRMDVHRYRLNVGLEPGGYIQSFRSRKDSFGSYSATGSSTVDGCTTAWSGSGPLAVPAAPGDDLGPGPRWGGGRRHGKLRGVSPRIGQRAGYRNHHLPWLDVRDSARYVGSLQPRSRGPDRSVELRAHAWAGQLLRLPRPRHAHVGHGHAAVPTDGNHERLKSEFAIRELRFRGGEADPPRGAPAEFTSAGGGMSVIPPRDSFSNRAL